MKLNTIGVDDDPTIDDRVAAALQDDALVTACGGMGREARAKVAHAAIGAALVHFALVVSRETLAWMIVERVQDDLERSKQAAVEERRAAAAAAKAAARKPAAATRPAIEHQQTRLLPYFGDRS